MLNEQVSSQVLWHFSGKKCRPVVPDLLRLQKCGKALCSRGLEAAIASRLAVPLDLRIIAARLEHGVLDVLQYCGN